jgi:hypothetical protein
VHNKHYVCVRTESRFFDITNHRVLTGGLVPKAREVSAEYVADLVVKSSKIKGKASRIKGVRKEEAV